MSGVVPRVVLTLGSATVILAGVIGLELREGLREEAQALPRPAASSLESSPSAVSEQMLKDQIEGYVASVLARPLFSPTRLPQAASALSSTPTLPRLSGIVVSPAEKHAIFAGSENGKSLAIGEGGHIGTYAIAQIDFRGVTVSGPDGQRILHPAFDPNPPPPPAPTLAKAAPQIPPLPPSWRGSHTNGTSIAGGNKGT